MSDETQWSGNILSSTGAEARISHFHATLMAYSRVSHGRRSWILHVHDHEPYRISDTVILELIIPHMTPTEARNEAGKLIQLMVDVEEAKGLLARLDAERQRADEAVKLLADVRDDVLEAGNSASKPAGREYYLEQVARIDAILARQPKPKDTP